jgi:hypothetical protein
MLLPPPTPIGLRLRMYEVTRLDVACAVGGILISAGAWWYHANWQWFVIGLLLVVLSWMMDRWMF